MGIRYTRIPNTEKIRREYIAPNLFPLQSGFLAYSACFTSLIIEMDPVVFRCIVSPKLLLVD